MHLACPNGKAGIITAQTASPPMSHKLNPLCTQQIRSLRSIKYGLAICAGFILSIHITCAQAPANLLRFTFDDAGPGTTTPSDTSLGGVSVNLTMLNGAGT